jgi:hypothetical protein
MEDSNNKSWVGEIFNHLRPEKSHKIALVLGKQKLPNNEGVVWKKPSLNANGDIMTAWQRLTPPT